MKHPLTKGVYVWALPPAAADVAIEQLRVAQGKRKASVHIVVIPKLMTPIWLQGLNKVVGMSFVVAPVHSYWGKEQHKKMIVAFVFLFLPYRPWQLRSTPKMLSMGRELSKVLKTPEVAGRNLLRNFLLEVRSFPTMPSRMV